MVAATVHVEPYVLVTPAPDAALAHALVARQTSVYHPPRALAL